MFTIMATTLKPPNMLKNIAIYVDISYFQSFWTSRPRSAQRFRSGDEILGQPGNRQCRTLLGQVLKTVLSVRTLKTDSNSRNHMI